jgi:hypothetical protein
MLRREPHHTYYVYPSWAELSYAWSDLPQLLADPVNSRYFRENPNLRRGDLQAFGFPRTIQPFELINGPGGGGIILAHAASRERWLPGLILCEEANLRAPTAMALLPEHLDPQVYYLEPMDEPGSELGLGKKKKLYLCHATPEHAEAAEAAVYWVIGVERAAKRVKGLEEVEGLARRFDLAVSSLQVPEALRQETEAWFISPEYDYTWFQVQGGGDGFGFHFAVVLYLALHLRKVAGKRMHCMHLVADIEGKTNHRLQWYKK